MNRKSGDGFALSEATLPAIGRAFDEGRLTAERLVQHYLGRIEAYDQRGPCINAVINLNPAALERARELDRERGHGGARGLLHGIPVVVKDTIDVAGMPTTGGFTALAESYPVRDATAIRRLRDAGAVILAKVNAAAAGAERLLKHRPAETAVSQPHDKYFQRVFRQRAGRRQPAAHLRAGLVRRHAEVVDAHRATRSLRGPRLAGQRDRYAVFGGAGGYGDAGSKPRKGGSLIGDGPDRLA